MDWHQEEKECLKHGTNSQWHSQIAVSFLHFFSYSFMVLMQKALYKYIQKSNIMFCFLLVCPETYL